MYEKWITVQKKVQASYTIIWERVHAHHSSCTVHTTVCLPAFCRAATIKISRLHKFPDLSATFGLFPDLSRMPWHFQVPRNSQKVVTLVIVQQAIMLKDWREEAEDIWALSALELRGGRAAEICRCSPHSDTPVCHARNNSVIIVPTRITLQQVAWWRPTRVQTLSTHAAMILTNLLPLFATCFKTMQPKYRPFAQNCRWILSENTQVWHFAAIWCKIFLNMLSVNQRLLKLAAFHQSGTQHGSATNTNVHEPESCTDRPTQMKNSWQPFERHRYISICCITKVIVLRPTLNISVVAINFTSTSKKHSVRHWAKV